MDRKEEKVKFLKNYLTFNMKIGRLKYMAEIYPDYKEKYLTEIEETKKTAMKIEQAIEDVDGGLLSEILYGKYLCGKSLETISYETNYSKRQIERLHISALEKLEIF